jgi:hypothetical protein
MAQVDTCANTVLVFLKLQFHRYEAHSPPLLRLRADGFAAKQSPTTVEKKRLKPDIITLLTLATDKIIPLSQIIIHNILQPIF